MPVAHDITNLVKELGLKRHPDRIADNAISEDTLAIHIWNHLIEKLKRNAPPAGSFIYDICKKHNILME